MSRIGNWFAVGWALFCFIGASYAFLNTLLLFFRDDYFRLGRLIVRAF